MRRSLLTWLVTLYLAAGAIWWARLLWKKTDQAFQAELAFHEKVNPNFRATEAFRLLDKKHWSQHYMVIGEGSVFLFLLFIALFHIHRSYRRELAAAVQQSNFLLSITHELKSPIAGIQLNLETLLKRKLEKPMADQLAANGLRDTQRLQNLVESLLLAARLEHKWQPQNAPVDLCKLLDETVEKLRARFPTANFSIESPPEDLWLDADAGAIGSVFENLLENAVKYSPEGSPITARVFEAKNGVAVSVADRGIGIPAGERRRIFKKFYRIGSEAVRETKGTGLGLFIVERVVKKYRGKIIVTDNRPRGTVFTLVFPQKR